MTILNVLVYVALIGYILFKRVQGQPIKAGRKLFVLPVLLVVLGYGDVTQGATIKPIEITLTVIGGASPSDWGSYAAGPTSSLTATETRSRNGASRR